MQLINNVWGNWRLKQSNWTLGHKKHGYELDLETITDSAQLLDCIFQAHHKRPFSNEDVRDLLHALDEIFDPQANLCSFGASRSIEPISFLRARAADADYTAT